MEIKIEEYKGWQILFDTERETFLTQSDEYDRQADKKSYSAIKKFIDEFIKENNTFKPIWIDILPSSYATYQKVKLIGIRKDGRFIYENKKGEKKQLSEYNEKDYIVYDPENDKIRSEVKVIQDQIDKLREERKAIESKITGKPLSEVKKLYTI